MKKIDGIWAWLGSAALVASLGVMTTACESDSDDGNDGGAGGQGGASSGGANGAGGSMGGSGGGSGGGSAASCEPPAFEAGGAGGDGGASGDVIEIAGEYDDAFGGTQTITATAWDSGSGPFYFSQVNNEEGFAIAQANEDDQFGPCGWNRFEWMIDGATIYYCQSAFGEATEADALAADRADQTNVEEGCGGFEWTQITPK